MTADAPHMTLRFLGTGGAFSRAYGTTCSLLTLAGGARWLIDCGRQAPDQLQDAGLAWHQIAGQIVTHVHGDHIFGLEDFAFMRFYESHAGVDAIVRGGPKPMFMAHSAVEAEVWESLAASLRYLMSADGKNPRSGTMASYFEMIRAHAQEAPRNHPWHHSESFKVPGLEMRMREVEHVPGKPSCCLEIEVGGGRIAWWSGDATVDADYLKSLDDRTNIFFHDCTFTDYPGQVHGSFSLIEKLPESIRKKMVIMHHEDNIESNRKRAEAIGLRVGMPGQIYDLVTGQLVSD